MIQSHLRLAPMMGYTNAPFRLLMRLIAPSVQLYTEMLTVNAVIHNPQTHYFYRFDEEGPVALQLGGCEPESMLEVAKMAEQHGFAEININCGCPSSRVLNGDFGAALMNKPELVAEMVARIKQSTQLSVSVKHRIGINEEEAYEPLHQFASACIQAGSDSLIVHARNAWLGGLSPRQNRQIPKLRPLQVKRLKSDFADANICINGEIKNLQTVHSYLQQQYADAVMIGRYAWDNPYFFAQIHEHDENKPVHQGNATQLISNRLEILATYFDIVSRHHSFHHSPQPTQSTLRYWLKPLVNLFHGCRGAKQWRRQVSTIQSSWSHAMRQLFQHAQTIHSIERTL